MPAWAQPNIEAVIPQGNSTQDVYGTEGDSTTYVGDADISGSSGGSGNQNSNSSSSSSSESNTISKEEQRRIDANDAKNRIVSTLNGYRDWIENSLGNGDVLGMIYSSGKPTSISNIGYYDVPVNDFLSNVVVPAMDVRNTYSDLLDSLGVGVYGTPYEMPEIEYEYAAPEYVYVDDGSGNLVRTEAVSDDGYQFDYSVYEDVLNAIEGTQVGSGSGSSGSGRNIIDYITGNQFSLINFNDGIGVYDINFSNDSYSNGSNFGNKRLPITGIRNDLVTGGFNDASNWFNRFTPYKSLYTAETDSNGNTKVNPDGSYAITSNAMSDSIVVSLIDEYAIETLTENELKATHYYENTRRWEIINAETGELYGTPLTQNPEITLKNQKGTWVITPYQKADYSIGTYGTWVKRQYLFDACTMNLLYFNENATSGTVCVHETTSTAWVPTGTSFVLHCDGKGNVTSDDDNYSGIERVK